MKNKTVLLIVLTLIILTVFAVGASGVKEAYVDPDTLVPSSDRVFFISDTTEYGDGTGSDAANPLRPMDHESFDPAADYPKYYLQTAFYQATEMLKETGGTVVICGPIYLGEYESYGSGIDTRDVFTANFGSNVIKFTSVYDGVDYRITNGAKITIETPAELSVLGSSVWENIDVETTGAERVMSFDEYPTLIGEGVNTYPSDSAYENVAIHYVSLAAGHRYASSDGEITSLKVKSGTYNVITGAFWGTSGGAQYMDNANTNLVLEGTTTVLGGVYGTLQRNSLFDGSVNITINGGVYKGSIYGVGPSGMLNKGGSVYVKINGGDFTNTLSIRANPYSHAHYAPDTSVLDISDFNGSDASYGHIINVSYDFTEIKKKSFVPVLPGNDEASVLVPSSDRVIFISDDYSFGDGSGSDANNPLRPKNHENFDPAADYPKYHLQTPFYQATEMLKEVGGTIVICGPTYFGEYESYGSGVAERDVFTAKFGTNVIKFTSKHDGVDYRITNGAKITIASPAMIGVYGSSLWENVDIETADYNRAISFSGYETVVGDGVNCYPADSSKTGVSIYYVSLTGGHRYEGGIDKEIKLTVKSGTYNHIAAGSWGVNNTRTYDADGVSIISTNNLDGVTRTKLVLEGTTKVYGEITGTTRQRAEFSGHPAIVINGGVYVCDITVVGNTGLINIDGTALLKIKGGNFENVWSVCAYSVGISNNVPAYSLLDLSEYNGTQASLNALLECNYFFDEVKMPVSGTPGGDTTDLNAPQLIDPSTLTPASEKVLFISDDYSKGDGSGRNADNPLRPLVHENFDPSVQYPKHFLMTAFYQATEMLKELGGTIVVCGPVHFDINTSYGSGDTTRDVETAMFGSNTIKITSVYGGVDYRETGGAKITLETPATLIIKGQTIWEDIDIETVGVNRTISFCGYATHIRNGVNCYPADEAFTGVAKNYIGISGAHRYTGGIDLTTNLLVESGTYNVIAGGLWGVNNARTYYDDGTLKYTNNMDGNSFTKIVLGGTTTVLEAVIGTNRQNAEFSGNSLIVINGGTYNCDIISVSNTGLLNYDGVVHLVINGGDFKDAWIVHSVGSSLNCFYPVYSLLDFSGWQGSLHKLAVAYNTFINFHEVKLPEGVTPEILDGHLDPGDVGHGDADGDGEVSADDAIYLLYSVLFGQQDYPTAKPFDVDGNGGVNADDAIYLLYHVLFGESEYPLS